MMVRLRDELARLEQEAVTLRKTLEAFGDFRRWQCPWCRQWSVKETKASSGPMRTDGMYACTECNFKGNGAYLLKHGCGGYRTLEVSDEQHA